jgi:hemoglobin-like flavoprotein
MTPNQVQLVQSALPTLVAMKEDVARLFYFRLFQLDPALRPLFKSDLGQQGQKLVAMLGTLISGLNRPEQVGPILRDLGRRHAGYGVQDRDYATVGTALLWTLERGLGAEFTVEMRDAWISAYFLVSRTMMDGGRTAGQALQKAS